MPRGAYSRQSVATPGDGTLRSAWIVPLSLRRRHDGRSGTSSEKHRLEGKATVVRIERNTISGNHLQRAAEATGMLPDTPGRTNRTVYGLPKLRSKSSQAVHYQALIAPSDTQEGSSTVLAQALHTSHCDGFWSSVSEACVGPRMLRGERISSCLAWCVVRGLSGRPALQGPF